MLMANKKFGGNGGNRYAGDSELIGAITSAMNRAMSKFGGDMEINGTINIDDSKIDEAQKKIGNLQKEAKKGIDLPITTDTSNVTKQIDKAMKSKKRTISITAEDVHKEEGMQHTIDGLYTKLKTSVDKTLDGGKLTDLQAEKYIKNYIQYKKYAEKFKFEIEEAFSDVFENIDSEDVVKNVKTGKYLKGLIDNLTGSLYADAEKVVNKKYATAEKKVRSEKMQEVKDADVAAQNENTAELERTAKRNEEIYNKLERVKSDAAQLLKDVGAKLGDGVDTDKDQDYYNGQMDSVELMRQKVQELKDVLSDLGVTKADKTFGQKIIDNNQLLTNIDSMISMYDAQISSAYEEMVSNMDQAQREAQEKIQKRTTEFISRVMSHDDFEKYGQRDWLDEYKEKLKDDATDIEALYAEFEQTISERKEKLQKIEQINTKRNELRSWLLDNAGFTGKKNKKKDLDDFLGGYKEYFDKLEAEGVEVSEVIEEIQNTFQNNKFSDAASAMAKEISEQFDITKNTVKELKEAIEEMMKEAEKTGEINIGRIRDILSSDTHILDEANPKDGDIALQIRSFLKGRKIKYLPDYKSESGDNYQSDSRMLGFNIMSKTGGTDLATIIQEMNDYIGTQLNTEGSPGEVWRRLIDTVKESVASTQKAGGDFVDYLLKINDIDFSSMLKDAIHKVNPDIEFKDSNAFLNSQDFLEYEDSLEKPYERGTEAVKEYKKAVEDVNEERQTQLAYSEDENSSDTTRNIADVVQELNEAKKQISSFYDDNDGLNQSDLDDKFDKLRTKITDLREELTELAGTKSQVEIFNNMMKSRDYSFEEGLSHRTLETAGEKEIDIIDKIREGAISAKDAFEQMESIMIEIAKNNGDPFGIIAEMSDSDILKAKIETLFEFDKTLDHFMENSRNQTSGRTFFDYLNEQGTDLQRVLFNANSGFEAFQATLRGLSSVGAVDYSSTLGLDTLDLKLREMNDYLGQKPTIPAFEKMVSMFDKNVIDEISKDANIGDIFDQIFGNQISMENGLQLLIERAHELGFTYDEVGEKWQKISDKMSESGQSAPNAEVVGNAVADSMRDATEGAEKTAEAAEKAAEGIKAEAEAARVAAAAKGDFTDANLRAAESANKTEKATNNAADGIKNEGNAAKNAQDNLIGNADLSPDERKIIKEQITPTKRSRTYQDERGRTYEIGQKYNRKEKIWEPFSAEVTNYLSFERDAIRVTNELSNAMLALDEAQRASTPDQGLISRIQQYIELLEEEQKAINEQAQSYADEHREYSIDLYNERVTAETNKHQAKNNIKDAEDFAKGEKLKQKAIEETEALLSRQEATLERYKQQLVDGSAYEFSDEDKTKVNDAYKAVKDKISELRSKGSTNKVERQELDNLIKQYRLEAQQAEKNQKVASNLRPDNLEAAKAKLNTDLQSTLRDMKESNADTQKLENELNDLIKRYESAKDKATSNTITGFQNELRTIKQNLKNTQDEYNFNQKSTKEVNDAINTFEKATDKVAELQAKLDASGGKGNPKLIQDLEDAKEAAEEAGQALDKVTDKFEGDITQSMWKRWTRAEETYKDPTQSAKYKTVFGNAQAQSTRQTLNQYANDRAEYQKLYQQALSGTWREDANGDIAGNTALTNEQFERMKSLMLEIKSIESNWNDDMAEGLELSKKQVKAREDLKAATKEDSETTLKQNAINSEATQIYNKMANRIDKMRGQTEWRAEGWSDEIQKLEDRLTKLNPADIVDEDSLTGFRAQINEILNMYQSVSKSVDFQQVGKDWQSKASSDLAKWMDTNKIAAKEFDDVLQQLKEDISSVGSKGEAQEWTARFQQIQADAADRGLLGKSLGDRFKDQFKNTMTSLATYYLSFQDFIRYGREAIQTVTELDTQLTEMRKVSNESLSTLQAYQLETFDIAGRVGTTASQISASTADWMRLGEELSEAKKSAEYSTVLLNVSEFTDINTATEALVAMSQAYQELDKGTIIDKLNNIGNNFSISTSELAESLQRSAGTLKVAGNTLDEAIALTVAGNQVLQNPQMVGQSLRTIALRLTGTSVQDMQEAGEEVDGLITTQSKLRQTIMDVTKVQKNGYKGFDILDSNGNYKTTYEMLKGIAEVWKEIGEEDKKMGTNRQSFLLETIAGKTRAAAASSILDNFEVLQDVYEKSLDSEGSAQQELDKYLDSIQGKTAQFKNALQELTASAIDSSWIKGLIDLGTQLLNVINDLGSAFGRLPTILGAVGGIATQVLGKGLLSKGKFNADNFVVNIGSGIKDGLKKVFTKTTFGSDIMDSMFGSLAKTTRVSDVLTKMTDEQAFALPDTFKNWWINLGKEKASIVTVGDMFDDLGGNVFSLGNAFSFAGNLATTFFSTLASTAVIMAAVAAVGALVKGIYDLVNAENIAIQRGQEARQHIQDISDSFNNKKEYTNNNLENYLKLREGTELTDNGIQNVSLSTEEYQDFITINKELADLFPSLVSGYDSQGNALLNLSSDADDATTSLSNLLEQERRIADFKVGEELGDAVTGFATRYKQLQVDIQNQQNIIDAGQELQSVIQDTKTDGLFDLSKLGVNLSGRELRFKYDPNDQAQADLVTKIQNAFAEAAHDYGGVSWNASDPQTGLLAGALMGVTDAQAEEIGEKFKNILSELDLSSIPEEIIDAMSTKNIDLSEIKADWNGLIPSILSQLNLYEQYQKLGDDNLGQQLQQIIADDISNMNFDSFTEADWKLFGDNPRQFVRERFLDPIINAISDDDGNFSESMMQEIIDTISLKDISYKDWIQKMNDLSMELFNGDYEQALQFRIALGVTYVDEDGNYYKGADGLENLAQITGLNIDDLSNLNVEDIELAVNATVTGDFDFKGSTLEELQQWIDDYRAAKERVEEIELDGTLKDIFGDESYSSAAEGYEKLLTSLTGALETIRTEGKLTAEQMRDLQEEFPDLIDFSEESIGNVALKELTGWVDEFKKHIDTLSPDGIEQLQTYVDNLTMSFGDLGVNAEEAMKAVYDSMIDPNASLGKQQGQSAQAKAMFDNLVSQIGSEGGEVNYQVIWELAMMDRFSDPAADIYAEYKDKELWWEVHVNYKKAIAEIERDNTMIQAQISEQEAQNAFKTSSGRTLNRNDYNDIVSGKKQLSTNAARALAEAIKADDGTEQAMTEIANKRADLYQARADEEEAIKQQEETILNEANKRIATAQAEAAKAQQKIDAAIANGTYTDQSIYEELADAQTAEANAQRDLADGYYQLIEILPQYSNEYSKGASEALSSAVELDTSAVTSRQGSLQNYITELGYSYEDLQTKATKYQDEITKAETNHQKVSDKTYKKLIQNGNDQIDILKKQRSAQIDLLRSATKIEDIRAAQSQIESINSSIAAMENEQIGWFETMTSLVSSNAQNLSSTLSSAFSEINSGTGLTIDTMNELQRQFSDIAGTDVSSLFYETADGMKFNVAAAEELVDAEYQLQQANLQEIISTNEKIAADQSATASAREQAEARIQAAQRELSMLQALYDEQKKQFSRLSQFQQAQQSENGGANFETMQGYLKTQNENRKKGLTGTDEFKAYTEYFDRWGLNTIQAWDRNKDKIERYLTDDVQGVINFMDDLVEKGFGTKEGDNYNLNLPSVEDAAAAMGMSAEWVRDMFGRAEDYGLQNDWVESQLDGHLKIKEAIQDQIREQLKYNQMLKEGASQTELDEQAQEVQYATDRINNINQELENFVDHTGEISESQIQSAISAIASIKQQYEEAKENGLSDDDLQGYIDSAQEIAKNNYLKFKGEVTDFEIDDEQLQKDFPGIKLKVEPDWSDFNKPSNYNEELVGTENIHPEEWYTEGQKLQQTWEDNNVQLTGYLNQLNELGLSYEELENIDLNDKQYDKSNEKLVEAEKILDNINTLLGSNTEEAQQLVSALDTADLLAGESSSQYYKTPTREMPQEEAISMFKETELGQIISSKLNEAYENAEYEQKVSDYQPIVDGQDTVNNTVTSGFSEANGHLGAIASALNVSEDTQNTGLDHPDTTVHGQMVADQAHALSNSDSLSKEAESFENVADEAGRAAQSKTQFSVANQTVAQTAKDTAKNINEETDSIGNAGDSANIAAISKDKFSEANKNASNTVKDTAQKAGIELQNIDSIQSADTSSNASVDVELNDEEFAAQIDADIQKVDELDKKSANPSINLDGQMFITQVQAAEQKLDELNNKSINPSANIDGGAFVSQANAASSKLDQLSQKDTKMSISLDGANFVSQVDAAKSKIDELSDEDITVSINLDGQNFVDQANAANEELNQLKDQNISTTINLDGQAFVAQTKDAQSKLDAINEKTVEPTLSANNSDLVSKTDDARARISALDGMSATPSVNVGGNASSMISSIESSLNSLNGREVVTRIVTEHVDRKGSGLGGINNNVALAGGNAFAGGKDNDDLPINYNGGTLVGEEAPEMHVSRDGGYWQLVGQNGPEFRDDIAPGDIVFNAEQTRKLLKNGHTNKRGKALAGGTQPLHGLAFAGNGLTNQNSTIGSFQPTHTGDQIMQTANAIKDATKSTKANTAAKDKETEATQGATSALQKFQNWANSFMDWIEVKIKRTTQRMELLLSKAENIGGSQTYQGKQSSLRGLTGYAAKNAYISDAMDENASLQSTYESAIGKKGGYTKHLQKVVSKAKSSKLITAKEAKRLNKLIQEGGLTVEDFSKYLKNKKNKNGSDSSKTENRATAYIQEYEKWYEKILDCQDGIQECVAKNKELQQQKLDNIIEEYESLSSFIEALNASADATVSLNMESGYSETYGTAQGNETRQLYQAQLNNQRSISAVIQNEMLAFQTEMENAAKEFGVDSVQYRKAETDYENMNQAFIQSEQNVKQFTRALYDLNLNPMEYALNRIKAAGQALADTVSLFKARGTMKGDASTILTEDKYTNQIAYDNDQIAKLTERIAYNKRIQEDLNYATDSAKWDELQKSIEADESSIIQLQTANEGLKDSIRELRWKPFEDLQKKVTDAISDFDHLRGLFNEEEFFDDDGEGWNFTKEGKANIALLGAQIMETRNQIADYREALNKVNKEYKEHVISQEEYEEYSRNMVETIQKLVENTENYKDALVDLYKTQISNENEALQKNIKLRQDALSKQREYYDYQKKVNSQQKDRNKILAQINALQGNSNQAARAQVARLREQLFEADEGLSETRRDHRYDLINEGYSKLSEDAQKSLDDTLRHVAANASEQERIVEQMLSVVKGNYDEAYTTIQQRITDTGTAVGTTAQTCMENGQLQEFFTHLDEETITPKNNWDQFINEVTKKIDTSAIDDFVTHLGVKLDEAKKIAAETAKALADAAKQQTTPNTNTGGTDNTNTTAPTSPSTPETQPVKQTDKVVEVIRSFKKGKNDGQGAIGDYIEKTFGKSTKEGDPTRLAKALGVHVDRVWTKAQGEEVLKQLKKHLKKIGVTNLKTLNAYKRGTLGTLTDELAWTHEGEIIRRSDGAILRQLPAGTQVIPKVESENLLKWAQIDPFKELKEGFKGSSQITNTSNNAPVFYYDSVIHIDGNVDADMMDRVEQLGKALLSSGNFQKGVVQKVTQEYKREFNKRY